MLGPGFGTQNMGVEALNTGTVASALQAFPQAAVWLLDYDDAPKVYEAHVGRGPIAIPMVNVRFSKKLYLPNNIARLLFLALLGKALPLADVRKRLWNRNQYLRRLLESDVVVALAGGDSFSDIYGLGRLWYVALPQLLALLLGRPLVLLPQTIGPFQTALGARIARTILRHARWIYTRDTDSLGEVERLLGHRPRHASFAYDMGFALNPLPPAPDVQAMVQNLRHQGDLVGLNVSGLLYSGGYTGGNQFGLRLDYREMIRRLILWFIERGAQVLLVPHVHGGPETVESDITACQQIREALRPSCQGRLHAAGALNHHHVKWVIGQCDFFLGSRMHACIAAVSQAVPALGLAYSRKFAGVFRTLEAEDLVVDLTRHDLPGVLRLVEERFQKRNELRQKLEQTAPKVRESVLGLFKRIEQQVLGGPGTSPDRPELDPAGPVLMERQT